MAISWVLEVRAFGETAWYDITNFVIGEMTFIEGRDVDTLGGAFPAPIPSSLQAVLSNYDGILDTQHWADRILPGAEARLRVGTSHTTAATRFQGALVRRDTGESDTYNAEWSDNIWKFTASRHNKDRVYIEELPSKIWGEAALNVGVNPELFRVSNNLDSGGLTSVNLAPGIEGLLQLQDYFFSAIRPLPQGGLFLEDYRDVVVKPPLRGVYEPGGEVNVSVTFVDGSSRVIACNPVPPVKKFTAVFDVVNVGWSQVVVFAPDDDDPHTASVEMTPGVIPAGLITQHGPRLTVLPSNTDIGITTPYEYIELPNSNIDFSGTITPIDTSLPKPHSQLTLNGVGATWGKPINITDRSEDFNGTYIWDFNDGDTNYHIVLKITTSELHLVPNGIAIRIVCTGTTRIRQAGEADKYTGINLNVTGEFQISNVRGIAHQQQELTFDFFTENADSIARYGRRLRERPRQNPVVIYSPLTPDFTLPASYRATIQKQADDLAVVHAKPNDVYSTLDTDEPAILARRVGDKEILSLKNGATPILVEHIETHFSGALAWQVVYYANPQPGRVLVTPPAPVFPKPFTATATWATRDLKVDITDADGGSGGVRYNVEIDTIDGSIPITSAEVTSVAAVSPATGFVASHTFRDSQANPTSNIGSVIITRETDDFKVVILRADFQGTYTPETTYPDFTITARWSGQNLLTAIAEADGDNKGNNSYRIIWSGGKSGSTNLTTNAQGAVSYAINNAYGVTSIRVTQTASGITKVLLAKDFSGAYTAAAFTTHWDRVVSRHSFHYEGWIADAPGGNGGVTYEVSFEDVLGVTLVWNRVVSDSTGRVRDASVAHTRAVTVIIVRRISDNEIVRFPVGSSPPTTGETDSFPSYRFTATWNRSSLILRIVEILGHDDSGGTEFHFTTAGRTPPFSETRTTSVNGLITITIPNASSVTSVTATRTADSHTTTITRDHFFGTPVSGGFTFRVQEIYRVTSNIGRFDYTILITDAPGINSATQYRVEGTFDGRRRFLRNTTSSLNGTWRAVVTQSHHSQGYSDFTVTRLTDNTQVTVSRDNYIRRATPPAFSVVVDEHDDGTHQSVKHYSYEVEVTDATNSIGGSINYTSQFIQDGNTRPGPRGESASNGTITLRFGTQRTRATAVIVTRTWDGRQVRINQAQFNDE